MVNVEIKSVSFIFKAAGTVSGQRKTKGHFFYFEGHFKGQKISRAFGALNQTTGSLSKIAVNREIVTFFLSTSRNKTSF